MSFITIRHGRAVNLQPFPQLTQCKQMNLSMWWIPYEFSKEHQFLSMSCVKLGHHNWKEIPVHESQVTETAQVPTFTQYNPRSNHIQLRLINHQLLSYCSSLHWSINECLFHGSQTTGLSILQVAKIADKATFLCCYTDIGSSGN